MVAASVPSARGQKSLQKEAGPRENLDGSEGTQSTQQIKIASAASVPSGRRPKAPKETQKERCCCASVPSGRRLKTCKTSAAPRENPDGIDAPQSPNNNRPRFE